MKIVFQKKFIKKLKKLHPKIQNKFYERLEIFVQNKDHKTLNNHSVDKLYTECRSINVTGDYRAIFKESDGVSVFINIGTHADLY